MQEIKTFEDLHSIMEAYISSKEITKPVVMFYSDHDDDFTISDEFKVKSHYAISDFPHDSNRRYVFAKPSDCDIYSYIVLPIETNEYLQFCNDIASKMHKPVVVIASSDKKDLIPQDMQENSYLVSISYESWMEWAKRAEPFDKPNISKWITDFLESVGEEGWAQHRTIRWRKSSKYLRDSVYSLLDEAPENWQYHRCVMTSVEKYDYNGIHPEVMREALEHIPEETWEDWMESAGLISNYLNQYTMPDGRYIEIKYKPGMTIDEKMGVIGSLILDKMPNIKRSIKVGIYEWQPRKVDLDMIEYFHIPVHEPKSK